ncbi:unnamed protein product [Cuscuta europaea]|uniref:MEP cytidylyltransferase n=1 Tax=Cuscuta europaea TaxID=41803 RepID=A0A9P1E7B1_CUSEU|nr:unnamed protein product [Cuscuta europaea]
MSFLQISLPKPPFFFKTKPPKQYTTTCCPKNPSIVPTPTGKFISWRRPHSRITLSAVAAENDDRSTDYVTKENSVSVIFLAGGMGKRMGVSMPKQYLPLLDQPIALYSFYTFSQLPQVKEIVVVCDPSYKDVFEDAREKIKTKLKYALPGKERQDSVYSGFQAVDVNSELICIHDSARPLVLAEDIEKVLKDGLLVGAAVLGVPAKATIKEANDESFVVRTLNRKTLWEMQTPQFRSSSRSCSRKGLSLSIVDVHDVKHSFGIWNRLQTRFMSASLPRCMELKRQLTNLKKKENQSMEHYLQDIKNLVDALAAVNSPVSDKELLESILRGLGPEYESFVGTIMLFPDKFPFDVLQPRLMEAEQRVIFNRHHASTSLHQAFGAAVGNQPHQPAYAPRGRASRGRGGRGRGGRGRGRNQYGQPHFGPNGHQPHLGQQGGQHSSGPQFTGQVPPAAGFGQSQPGAHLPRQTTSGHSALHCPSRFSQASVALMVPGGDTNDNLWYPDSGASAHMTPTESREGLEVTDDVSIVELLNHPVYITKGSYTNIKVTTPDDLLLAERILHTSNSQS